jgi:hypothetical protein
MATIRPELTESALSKIPSAAEVAFYRACVAQLPDDVLVVFSATWISPNADGSPTDGEADFTLFFPNYGFLTVEIKGGGIELDGKTGQWASLSRYGKRYEIKDPFRQATKEKYCILDQLKGHNDWRHWNGRRVLSGHAVFFPDCDDVRKFVGPNRLEAIIGCGRHLKDLNQWLEDVNKYWAGTGHFDPLTPKGVKLAHGIFCSSISVPPLLVTALEIEEEQRIVLTDQQARILRTLGGRKRAIICGGAGTGKTLIAAEKAKQLAADGKSVLLLCYNRPLADFLSSALSDLRNIVVANFHQLCASRIADARDKSGRDVKREAIDAYPDEDELNVQFPFALALANEILGPVFDAVIVDEAQDFSDEYWFGVEEVLRDSESGYLYLFTDPNQAVYKRSGTLPIDDEPYYLYSNCRNTAPIHNAAYRYYAGESVEPPPIAGAPVEIVAEATLDSQARAITDIIGRLLHREKVSTRDVVILLARPNDVPGLPNKTYWNALLRSAQRAKLPLAIEGAFPETKAVLVDTVKKFKGLEAQVVILWLAESLDELRDKETLYVGISRAKSRLFVVGREIAL